jgi:AcrR family transcriptional regulator
VLAGLAVPGRSDGDATRVRILRAAREELSERGCGGATVRAIAARAGVSDALVYHHFGSRGGVLSAALRDAARVLRSAPAPSSPADAGALLRAVLPRWESAERRSAVLAVIRSALTRRDAARLLLDGLVSPERLGLWPGGFAGEAWCPHAMMVGAQLVGVMTARHIIRVEPLASAALDQLVEQLSPAIDRYLDDHAASDCRGAHAGSPD